MSTQTTFFDDLDNLSQGAKDSLRKAVFPNLHNLFSKFETYTVLVIVVILCVCFFNQILEQILRLKTSINSIGCNLGIFKSLFPELHRQTHPATILPIETQQIISALQLKQKSMEHQLLMMLQRLDNQNSPKLQQLIPFNGRNRAIHDVAETIPFLQFNSRKRSRIIKPLVNFDNMHTTPPSFSLFQARNVSFKFL